MKELGQIVSENLIFLRKKAGMTQLEFGEKFNYTDKTVSRWENGSIIHSVEVLKQIAEYYGVTVDYLISEHHSASEMSVAANKSVSRKNKAIIAGLLITVVWTIALVIYLANVLKSGPNNIYWKTFVWAVPLSLFLVAFFNYRWFANKRWTLITLSLAVWTTLAAAYITFLPNDNHWYIFLIGVPIQVALILLLSLRSW